MTMTVIALRRLYQQRLTSQPFITPEEVVSYLGAVQSQEYLGAQWSLGMRMQNATDDIIDLAFNEGRILRTHVMRPTWHFVTPSDIRWLLELTAPRVNAINAYMYRQYKLDDALFTRCNEILIKTLQGGHKMTRVELGMALTRAGITTDNMRLGLILHRAELDAIICSGSHQGKQSTHMLLPERAPQARSLPRQEALAELTLRYYTSHGPATIQDFAWWSGLSTADVKGGLALVADQLTQEIIDGQTYWYSASQPPLTEPAPQAFLLPTYDEFLVGFSGFGKAIQNADQKTAFSAPIVINGQVVGRWKRTLKSKQVVIELAPFTPLTPTEEEAINTAAQRYGAFLGLQVVYKQQKV
ncbi:winged helix DNA-binding domain-containing protein [Ktedonospora formicarum]|uniref:Winged helix DNA-binding domain-containing protein n=1 Tax=Ktedonospora formicarum TaxID=2778364 RepID=A0A8J3I197_9CHLR|nr:winged helix DNA-binding domain-containing protein [Ktedonospora formicarum]GHO44940.1 hypothetical protein KSX_31030 [Ktedonospora formicarum]